MRKLSTLFLGMILILCGIQVSQAQNYWKNPIVDENFDGLTGAPEGLTVRSDNKVAIMGRNGGTAFANDVVTFSSNNNSGNRGSELVFTSSGTSELVVAEFDIRVNSATSGAKNAMIIALMGSNSVINSYGDFITGVYLAGASGKWHVWNKDIQGPVSLREGVPADTIISVFPVTSLHFGRAGTATSNSADITLAENEATITEVTQTPGAWYHMSFELNFTTKKVTVTITETENPDNAQVLSDLDFISDLASDISVLSTVNTKGSSSGNGGNVTHNVDIDNLLISELVESIGLNDVTVKYQDYDGNPVREDKTYEDQEVSLNFGFRPYDIASFVLNGFYHSYDADATGVESVVVEAKPAVNTLIAKFKKTQATAGVYNWNGYGDLWSELDENFTVNSANLAYQNDNSVKFGDVAGIKDVMIVGNMNLGSGNVVIDAEGYTLTGAGTLAGTGAIEVNASTTIGFVNKMTGGVNLNAGTLEVTNIDVSNGYVMDQNTTLNINTGVDFKKPITGFGGAINIIATQNATFSPTITDVETVNIQLTQAGRTTATWTNNWGGTVFPEGINVNVSKVAELDTIAGFGIGDNNFANVRLNLGDDVRLVRFYNQGGSGATSDTYSTMKIGELSGSEGASLEGCITDAAFRHINFEIGGLGTDATFAGKIQNYPTVTTNSKINIYKKGAGIWRLTGNSTNFLTQIISVDEGTLQVDGVLGAIKETENGYELSIPVVTVAEGAKLSGSGEIYSLDVNINGSLEGSLYFPSNVTLLADREEQVPGEVEGEMVTVQRPGATTIINVNGSNDIDMITVEGDFTYGGKLYVNLKSLPEPGDYQIFQLGNIVVNPNTGEGFDSVEISNGSQNWSYDYATGMLTYKGGDPELSIKDTNADSKVVSSLQYFDLTGKVIGKDAKGFVIVKENYTDGTSKAFKYFNR